MTTRLSGRILIEHKATRLTSEATAEEEVVDCTVDEKNDTFSPYVVPGDVSTFKAAGLGAIASLANRQDNDFDPEVGAQLVQAKEQAYLPFGKEKR